MSVEKSIESLVDKAIEGIEKDDDINKRKPKPSFRYLTDKDEIKKVLESETLPTFSVMKNSITPKIVDEKLAVIGLGDVQTIESVLKKHQASRKFNK